MFKSKRKKLLEDILLMRSLMSKSLKSNKYDRLAQRDILKQMINVKYKNYNFSRSGESAVFIRLINGKFRKYNIEPHMHVHGIYCDLVFKAYQEWKLIIKNKRIKK